MFYCQVVFSKIGMRLQDFALTFHRLRSFGQPKSAQRSHQGKLLVATKTGALLSSGVIVVDLRTHNLLRCVLLGL